MHKVSFHTQVLSPLMSYGVSKSKPELRATEIKALMRQTFRISHVLLDSKSLFIEESKWFGNAKTASSPISLQIKDKKEVCIRQKLLLHDRKSEEASNREMHCFSEATEFTLLLRGKNLLTSDKFKEYQDLLRFSIYLGGIGRRSRRGRGAISFRDYMCANKEDLITFLMAMLDKFSPSCFMRKANTIISSSNPTDRPTIEKIEIGETLSEESVQQFLKAVDQASHDSRRKENGQLFATGAIKHRKITGSEKFASSLMVSLVKTKDQCIYPIYIFVKPVTGMKIYDNREEFLTYVEGGKS